MIETFVWILKSVRENILEKFMLPGLGISYWDFCISLLIVGLLITVLVNGVKSSKRSENVSSDKPKKK